MLDFRCRKDGQMGRWSDGHTLLHGTEKNHAAINTSLWSNCQVSERKRHDVTIMLITVVLLFLLCQIPIVIYHIFIAFGDDGDRLEGPRPFMNMIANVCLNLNTTINFIP